MNEEGREIEDKRDFFLSRLMTMMRWRNAYISGSFRCEKNEITDTGGILLYEKYPGSVGYGSLVLKVLFLFVLLSMIIR